MKKLICALLVVTMLLGSVSAFAGTICQHKEDIKTRRILTGIDGCTKYYDVETYCVTCGEVLGTNETSTTTHKWVEEIHDGEPVTVCENCGMYK